MVSDVIYSFGGLLRWKAGVRAARMTQVPAEVPGKGVNWGRRMEGHSGMVEGLYF